MCGKAFDGNDGLSGRVDRGSKISPDVVVRFLRIFDGIIRVGTELLLLDWGNDLVGEEVLTHGTRFENGFAIS
jgi:hypothetical protein